MSLKQEIESWVEALKNYDAQDYEKALQIFEENADTSKIWFNIGMIHATLADHEQAIIAYQKATKLDQFLAVAYFQQGVSNFLLTDYQEALANFNEALLYLRGNNLIDYEQLGLKFRLYSCEVLFNRGLCYIYAGQFEEGMQDLNFAAKEKQTEEHKVIDEAIAEEAVEYTVFSIPIGVIYRPNEQKVRNVKQKDYLGKARLVAASDRANAFTGFAGSEVKKILDGEKPVDDRKESEISWAATNLVKPGLVSSQRLADDSQGVGPFPPTPPPEKDTMRSIAGPQRSNTFAGTTRAAPPPGRANTNAYRANTDPRDRAREEDAAVRRNNTTRERAMPPPPREERRDSGSSGRRYAPAPQRSASTASTRRQPPPPLREQQQRRRPSAIEEQYGTGAQQDYNERDELYDLYREEPPRQSQRAQSVAGSRRGQSRRAPSRQRYVEEEQYSDEYSGSSVDDDFEILETRGSRSSRSSRQIEVKKYKVKCHGKDDTRMIMITPNQDYREFTQRIKDKFGLTGPIKCQIRDEDGDGMIALYDQEDLENCISTAKSQARKEKAEIGKIEIWVKEG